MQSSWLLKKWGGSPKKVWRYKVAPINHATNIHNIFAGDLRCVSEMSCKL